MKLRRRRRPGSDRLYVTTDAGLPLGHVDLLTRTEHDVPALWADAVRGLVDTWLFEHGRPPLATGAPPAPPQLETGTATPAGGWPAADGPLEDPDDDDLALHLPGHGLHVEASRVRASGGSGADRPLRLRADGRHAVADALAKLSRGGPGLRRGRGRWRMLHGVAMLMRLDDGTEETVLIDHVVVGPAGVFVVEVQHHPGGGVVVGPQSLEIDRERIDLNRRRAVGEEAEERLAESLAIAAGAETTLNPPPVTPVIAVVGAVVIGHDRPRGVLVARVGQLPRLLQAFGTRLTDEAVEQTFAVARQAVTWTR